MTFWVIIVEKIENAQKIALFFCFFFSHHSFFLAAPGDVPFSSPRKEEIKCHVVLTLYHTAIQKEREDDDVNDDDDGSNNNARGNERNRRRKRW